MVRAGGFAVSAALVGMLLGGAPLAAQARSKVERLGYPAGTKLLIVHADDIGMAHAQNAASIAGLEAGTVSSGSVLVTAPWAPAFAAWYREHREADVGVHLALTAEWQDLRWPGALPREEVPSLYDAEGFLPRLVAEVAQRARADEVERELRAQLARARELGIEPTHLDTHMLGVMATPEIFAAYLRVAREHRLPAYIPPQLLRPDASGNLSPLGALVDPDEVLVDRYIIIPAGTPPQDWEAFYTQAIAELEPGTITQLLLHLGYDDAELRAVTTGHEAYGAAWRQRDADFFLGDAVPRLLAQHGVRLTTWRELGGLLPAR